MDFLGLFLYLQNINKKILLVKNNALEDNDIKNPPQKFKLKPHHYSLKTLAKTRMSCY